MYVMPMFLVVKYFSIRAFGTLLGYELSFCYTAIGYIKMLLPLLTSRLTADLPQQGFVRLFLGDLTTSWATLKCSLKMPMICFWSRNEIVYLLIRSSSYSVQFVDGCTGEGNIYFISVIMHQWNSLCVWIKRPSYFIFFKLNFTLFYLIFVHLWQFSRL
jgi:hypothetical protein